MAFKQSFHVNAKDGTKLFVKKDIIDDPKAVVIIVHGIAEHLGRYDDVVHTLNDAGYLTVRYDQRGHGQSEGPRGDLKHWQLMVDDLELMVNDTKEEYPTLKCFLLGHSMGGLIVNNHAVLYDNVDGIISSAAVAVFLKDVWPLRILGHRLLKNIYHQNKLSETICSDQSVGEAYANDPLVLKKMSFRLIGTQFVQGVRHLRKHIDKHHVPSFFCHGTDDKIVPIQASEWLYKNTTHADKTFKKYDNMYHEILNDKKKKQVLRDMITWLNKRA